MSPSPQEVQGSHILSGFSDKAIQQEGADRMKTIIIWSSGNELLNCPFPIQEPYNNCCPSEDKVDGIPYWLSEDSFWQALPQSAGSKLPSQSRSSISEAAIWIFHSHQLKPPTSQHLHPKPCAFFCKLQTWKSQIVELSYYD